MTDGTTRKPPPPIALADALVAAWKVLYPDGKHNPGNAGVRAALRRAATPQAVLLEPAFHALLRRMREKGADLSMLREESDLMQRLALAAGLLAQRRDGESASRPHFMAVLGGSRDPQENRLKPLRFQALMAALDRGSGEDQMKALRRAMTMAGDAEFNVHALVRDLLWWDDQARIRWTFDYFGRHRDATGTATEHQTPATENTP